MIQANELRIGNLCLNHNKEYHEVSINDFHRFNVPKMDSDYGLYPIPLTEEILLKCSFKHQHKDKIGEDFFMLNLDEKYYLTYNIRKHRLVLQLRGIGVSYTYDCKSLHHLQNIYFTLKNEELEINLL